jgi:electron transfer flavoprotein beta subunit
MAHIVVFTKSTPDTAAKVEVTAAGAVSWGNAQLVLNPWDEYSITEAMLLKEAHKADTTAIAIGDEAHNEALKQALAIGIDAATRIWDSSMANLDSLGYAKAAAAAIKKLGNVDLVLFGKEFADLGTDSYIYQLGRLLGWATFGSVSKIPSLDFAGKTIRVERAIEEGKQTVSGKLPAVVSVLKDICEPRSPSFIGIRKASKANIPVWSAADLGLSLSAKTNVAGYQNLPSRAGNVQLIEGSSEQERAEKLVAKLLEEKVI